MLFVTDVLPAHLKKQGLTQAAFARRVGRSASLVSMVMSQERTVPIKSGEKWADELGLRGAEREIFLDAVHLSAASRRVHDMVARLESENTRLKKRLKRR